MYAYSRWSYGEIIGSFVGNSTKGTSWKNNGGSLNIWSDAVVDSIHGVFIGNTATNNSGAINNGGQSTTSTIKVITGDFIANSALKGNGGAILNEKTTAGTDSKIYAITGDYIGNAAKGTADNTGRGGAIYNRGLIYDVIGDYIGNAAEGSTSNSTTGLGGAIYNENSMRYITGDYVGNRATNDGGAIYNSGNITSVTADFIGNRTSNGKGAGIYNSGTIALVAETKDMLFYDNKDNTKYNDIYQKNGTIAINAAENHNIIFNGTIEGDNGTININNGSEENINGNYEFNNIISGNDINEDKGINLNKHEEIVKDCVIEYDLDITDYQCLFEEFGFKDKFLYSMKKVLYRSISDYYRDLYRKYEI